jgi:hypothetical protein
LGIWSLDRGIEVFDGLTVGFCDLGVGWVMQQWLELITVHGLSCFTWCPLAYVCLMSGYDLIGKLSWW